MRVIGKRYGRLLTITALVTIAMTAAADGQQTDADFDAYCRDAFTNSVYQRYDQSWGTEHACVQGATRQGIDLAKACVVTTGNPEFETSGSRVLCSGTPSDKQPEDYADVGEPDLSNYCIDRFPGSSYETRAEPSGFEHYCRRAGSEFGYVLQPIDLELACKNDFDAGGFRRSGVRVFCKSDQSDDPAESVLANNQPSGPSTIPLNPPWVEPPSIPSPMPQSPSENNRPQSSPDNRQGWDSSQPVKADVAGVCGGQWRSGTLPEVEQIMASRDQIIRARTADCQRQQGMKELCIQQTRIEMSMPAFFQMAGILSCHLAFLVGSENASDDDIRVAQSEACAIEPIISGLVDEVNDFGGQLRPIHYFTNMSEIDFRAMCDCSARSMPDIVEIIDEIEAAAKAELLAEFSQ